MSKKKNNKSMFFKATTAAAVAASTVAVAVPAITEASTFPDVKPDHQFYDAITELENRGIISGFQDGTFKPNNTLTRGQAAKIIAGVLELDTKNVADPGFKDVPSTNEYYGAIAALKAAGIIDGYEDGTYRSGNKIQRNHMAKIIANAMGLEAKDANALPFKDVNGEYKEAIAALYENGVTTGKTATTFDGVANVTRGQMAAFIVRAEKALENEVPVSDEVVVEGNTVTFTVSDYTNNTITIGEETYTYDTAVRPIFTQANKTALNGAKLKVTVADGEIKKVNSITLNKSGVEATPVVFAAGDVTVDTLTVNGNYVSVKNVKVTGNVTVTNKATNKVEFTGVAVTGDIIVDNKGAVAVASLDNKFAQDNVGVEVVLNETTFANIIFRASATLSGKANPAVITVEGVVAVALNLEGTIASLKVTDANAKVTLGANVKVTTLHLPAGTKAEDIITNYSAVSGQIGRTVIGNATSSGGGGGGGSSSTAFKSLKKSVPNDKATLGLVGTAVTTSDEKVAVATIDSGNIVITSKARGTATITVTDEKANKATIQVTVARNGQITVGAITEAVAPPTTADTAALKVAIEAIEYVAVSTDGSDVATTAKWTDEAAKTALETAVAKADAVAKDAKATQEEVDAAVEALKGAVATYVAAQKAGTKVGTPSDSVEELGGQVAYDGLLQTYVVRIPLANIEGATDKDIVTLEIGGQSYNLEYDADRKVFSNGAIVASSKEDVEKASVKIDKAQVVTKSIESVNGLVAYDGLLQTYVVRVPLANVEGATEQSVLELTVGAKTYELTYDENRKVFSNGAIEASDSDEVKAATFIVK